MARPNWEYIRVDVLLPDHPKLDGLSPAAKWTLLELWCWCGQHRTDGFVRESKWRTFGSPAARAALVKAGLAERYGDGWQMHDYLGHQRSRAEIEALSARRAEAGRKSGAARAKAKASAEQDAEQLVQQDAEQNANKTRTEAEAEAEVLRAEVVRSSSRRNTRSPDDDHEKLIADELKHATGRDITPAQAADVRRLLLDGRDVADPAAYLRQAIRTERDPAARFLPAAAAHPSARSVAEAVMDAGLTPNGTPLRGPAVAAIAARARAALHTPKGTEP